MKKQKFAAVMLSLALICLMAIAVSQRWRFPLVNQAVGAVLLPINSLILSIHDAVADFGEERRSSASFRRENEELKKKLQYLGSAEYRLERLQTENQKLSAMVGYKESNPDQTLLPARVVGVNLGDLHDALFIDKGSRDGVTADMPVIANECLAGVIDEVYAHYSRFSLISSSRVRIGVRVLRHGSNAVGVLTGTGSAGNLLKVDYIGKDADIRDGDMIVTSGMGGKYPAGIFVGYTARVEMDTTGLQKTALVESAARIETLDKLYIVMDVNEAKRIEKEAREASENAARAK